MFLGQVQIGSYWIKSIRVGSFRFWFLRIKRNLDPKCTCKFSVPFRIGYFLIGSGSGFRVEVKILRPILHIHKIKNINIYIYVYIYIYQLIYIYISTKATKYHILTLAPSNMLFRILTLFLSNDME